MTPIYKLKSSYLCLFMIVIIIYILYTRYKTHKTKKETNEVINKKIDFEKKLEEIMPSSYVSNKNLENIPNPFVTEWLDRPHDMMTANVVSHLLKSNQYV